MLYLSDILEFVINGLYNGSFPCQQSVRHGHQSAFHVALQFCDQLNTVNKQTLEQFFADIAFVSDKNLLTDPTCFAEVWPAILRVAAQANNKAT